MKRQNSRREFLKIISIAPVGTLLLQACGSSTQPPVIIDQGRGDTTNDGSMTADVGPDLNGGDVAVDSSFDSSSSDVAIDTTEDVGTDTNDMSEEVCEATGSDVEGPFHEPGAPNRTQLASASEVGSVITVRGTVVDEACVPIAGALLDVWHADDEGEYHDATEEYRLRGQMMSDENGNYEFRSIKPGRYALGNSTRPAHVHFIVSKPGFTPLTTQLYFEGDPFLSPNDPCGAGCNSGDATLIVPLRANGNDGELAEFQIVLTR